MEAAKIGLLWPSVRHASLGLFLILHRASAIPKGVRNGTPCRPRSGSFRQRRAAWPAAGAAPGAELGSRTLSLFDSKAQRVDDTVIFTKWTRAVTRHNFQTATHVIPCGTPKNESCFLGEWRESLTGMEKQPKRAQLELVNKYLNASPYVLDIATWGIADYWETPLEFLMFSGDCEDYAIAKFFSLLRLGFSNEQVQIVIVQDQNLRIPHAVLAVTLDGANYILDNQIPQVVRDTVIHHYTPMYGVNLTGWWRFSSKSNNLAPDGIAPRP